MWVFFELRNILKEILSAKPINLSFIGEVPIGFRLPNSLGRFVQLQVLSIAQANFRVNSKNVGEMYARSKPDVTQKVRQKMLLFHLPGCEHFLRVSCSDN